VIQAMRTPAEYYRVGDAGLRGVVYEAAFEVPAIEATGEVEGVTPRIT
jgi:hypothetical protein